MFEPEDSMNMGGLEVIKELRLWPQEVQIERASSAKMKVTDGSSSWVTNWWSAARRIPPHRRVGCGRERQRTLDFLSS